MNGKVGLNSCIVVLLLLMTVSALGTNSNCSYCRNCPTPRYIAVFINGVSPVNTSCYDGDYCAITSGSINGIYILNQDPLNPCKWCNVFQKGFSNRIPGFPGGASNPPDTASGLRICVIRGRYSSDTSYVFAETASGNEFGYALYFCSPDTPVSWGCVNSNGATNGNVDCYCSGWYYIPPWSAGIGGSVEIREMFSAPPTYNLTLFAEFADFEPSFEDLGGFFEEWLEEI
ncbi:MAG: hypothetical protein MUP81_03180 [Dehalococcoidia bacterium]|nr:hypothetical protein [Dehalococcoidia bacterium]